MRILLDTHILLWAVADDPQLSPRARALIEDESNELLFSSVSLSEISLKHAVHPQDMVVNAAEARRTFESSGFKELIYDADMATTLDGMALHHKDPFDRMLIAQAKTSGIKIMSHDKAFPAYGDFVLAV